MAAEPEFVDSKNVSWLNSKGSWLAYILLILGLHFFLMTVPMISVPTVWTLTNVFHSLVSKSLYMHEQQLYETFDGYLCCVYAYLSASSVGTSMYSFVVQRTSLH